MLRALLPLVPLMLLGLMTSTSPVAAQHLRLGTFDVDATPQVGSPLAYDPMREATGNLSCRGVVLQGSGRPIVICALDWIGVANEANEQFRQTLAEAVGSVPERVVVHALHQHDAPRADLTAAAILSKYGISEAHYDVPLLQDIMQRAAAAAADALEQARPVTAVHTGEAEVQEVASNRRMIGPDGKVHTTRYTACKDPDVRALPIGVIDPTLRLLTFEGAEGPLAAITVYATHPQSYYRTGQANPDFPGMARDAREEATGVFHLHLNGAGGNVGAGKYNDGSHANRQVLADRMADAMQKAWDDRQPQAFDLADVAWSFTQVECPVGGHLDAEDLEAIVKDEALPQATRAHAAAQLGFLQRRQAGSLIQVSRLKIGDTYLLFLPGELFVEYQLAAQAMKPEANVFLAAYGDYGTGYIGTRIAYPQGGYEVSERASNVSPEIEAVLLRAVRELLEEPQTTVSASDFTETTGPALKKVDESLSQPASQE